MDGECVKKKMTIAERVSKYRKKKEENDLNFKSSESKRVELLRKSRVSKMANKDKKKYQEAARERQRKCREKKKLAAQQSLNGNIPNQRGSTNGTENSTTTPETRPRSYKTPQSLGKAVRRSLQSLPYSPTKKIEVLSGVAKRIGLKLVDRMEEDLCSRAKFSREQDKDVIDFYYRNDIVYTMPGLKDEMVVWENGTKKRLRKYYLTVFLREAFAIYRETNVEGPKVCFSSFCALRPKNVLLLKDTPMDQCKCKYHENFKLMLKGLSINYDGSWWNNILCDPIDLESACWNGECEVCAQGQLWESNLEVDFASQVTWQKWAKNDSGRLVKASHEGCAGELIELVKEAFPSFAQHVKTKRIQAAAFDYDLRVGNKKILQIDFAMAYSCEYQSEVQSALWSRASVQLFTAALFYDGKCQKTYLVCSDTKDKNKDTVFVFLMKLFEIVMNDNNAEEIIIFSDGPSSEFKNKYMVQLLVLLKEKFKVNFTWKYFATSHGKGIVDGIGGRAKSLVRQLTQAQGDKGVVVQSSKDFYQVVSTVMKSTEILHISQEEIDATIAKECPWKSVADIGTGIQKTHVISCKTDGSVSLYENNVSKKPLIQLNKAVDFNDLNVGDWCLVKYDNDSYPGELLEKTSTDIKVSVMVKSGNYWKWPKNPDIIYYTRDSIQMKLSPPEVVNARGHFKFENLN